MERPNPFGQVARSYRKYVLGLGDEPAQEVTETFEVVDELPDELKGAEKERELCYPDYLDHDHKKQFPLAAVHNHGGRMYRGHDVPRFRLGVDKNSKEIATWRFALICIRDVDEAQQSVFGHPSHRYRPEDSSDGDLRLVQFMVHGGSQRPSIHLRINRERGEDGKPTSVVFWKCYAHSCVRNTDSEPAIGLEFGVNDDATVREGMPQGSRQLRELAGENSIWATHLLLNDIDKQPTTGATGRPVWRGITPAEIDQLATRAAAGEDLTEADRAIVALHRTSAVSIYTWVAAEQAEYCRPFFQYIRTVFFATATMGPWWYYRLASPEEDLDSANYPFEQIPPPRWLVTRWSVKRIGGKAVDASPVAWNKLSTIPDGIFPDLDGLAFEMRLGVAREADKDVSKSAELRALCRDQAGRFASLDAVDTFKDKINLLMTGGRRSSVLEISSMSANEASDIFRDAIVVRPVEVQRPLHPRIADFPNREIYDGQLKIAEANDVESALRELVEHLLEPLRNTGWNRSPRIGIDTSETKSELFGDTTSSVNDGEAAWILDTVVGFVLGGVNPVDIVIISPYYGQRRLVWKLLQDQDKSTGAKEVRVLSISEAESQHAKIAIVSLVANDPDKIGYICHPHDLCVEITRGSDYLFILGSFGKWAKVLQGLAVKPLHYRANALFRHLILGLFAKKEVITLQDWNDVMK
ncbi:AAA domain-containing protein [Neohortaea acidophila]|uniref:AAA domain-containing protein n=1 Tax=Neohortaea acidophila TaxID=245834 RepID=A0A6A6PHU5_9PEZI|nr:AAA domain-containing protein [Neohortaea acidophila]KAF2479579.1 AAA domain-containing protein [Neohortaea acidophila]